MPEAKDRRLSRSQGKRAPKHVVIDLAAGTGSPLSVASRTYDVFTAIPCSINATPAAR